MRESAIYSFFSGAGFLDLGFEHHGFEIALVNEIHEPFVHGYRHARQTMGIPEPTGGYVIDDIDEFATPRGLAYLGASVAASRVQGKLVGFVGGPPCPDFSVGGKNKGATGENGRLSDSYVNLICEVKPDFFLFENVKGLWRTKRHRAFYDSLQERLINAGYLLEDRLINAIEYGTPQDRDRIIMIGFLKSKLTKNPSSLQLNWKIKHQFTDRTAFEDFSWPSSDGDSNFTNDRSLPGPDQLQVGYWFKKNCVDTHPNAQNAFTARTGLAKFESVAEGDVTKKSYKRLHRARYSPTAAYGNNEVHIHPWLPRRISVAEALAIQSLPAAFSLPPDMTLTNMFKTIGNGVPYLAACGLAATIAKFIEENFGESDSRKSHHGVATASPRPVVRLRQPEIWNAGSHRRRETA